MRAFSQATKPDFEELDFFLNDSQPYPSACDYKS